MFVDVMIRRRAKLDEPIPALNARLLEQFIAVPCFWGQGKTAADAPFEQGETGSLDLRKSLRGGLSGQVVYMPRFVGYLSKDVSKADDTLRIRLDTDKVDYAAFCAETLPRLITMFEFVSRACGDRRQGQGGRLGDRATAVAHDRPEHRRPRQHLSHLAGVLVRWGVVPAGVRHHRGRSCSSRVTRMRACRIGCRLRVADCDLGDCCRCEPGCDRRTHQIASWHK